MRILSLSGFDEDFIAHGRHGEHLWPFADRQSAMLGRVKRTLMIGVKRANRLICLVQFLR